MAPALAFTLLMLVAVGVAGQEAPDAGAAQPWIAYSTIRGGESTWLVHPDGADDHQITGDFAAVLILPDWSPDGQRLVMTSRATGGAEPLYEYELASGRFTQLFDCEDPCLGDDEPVYSPDGTTVAFERALGPFEDDVPADCGIWIGELATGEVRQVTSNPGCFREYNLRWSPDGHQFTYWRWREDSSGTTTGAAVFVIDVDGSNERQLTEWEAMAGEPDWAPDGEWLVYDTYAKRPEVSNLYRMHPDGTGAEPLTFITEGEHGATQARYTPDGESIVFTAELPGALQIWYMPAGGGEPSVVVDGGTHGTWQPSAEPA
jgi:TolB protein